MTMQKERNFSIEFEDCSTDLKAISVLEFYATLLIDAPKTRWAGIKGCEKRLKPEDAQPSRRREQTQVMLEPLSASLRRWSPRPQTPRPNGHFAPERWRGLPQRQRSFKPWHWRMTSVLASPPIARRCQVLASLVGQSLEPCAIVSAASLAP